MKMQVNLLVTKLLAPNNQEAMMQGKSSDSFLLLSNQNLNSNNA